MTGRGHGLPAPQSNECQAVFVEEEAVDLVVCWQFPADIRLIVGTGRHQLNSPYKYSHANLEETRPIHYLESCVVFAYLDYPC